MIYVFGPSVQVADGYASYHRLDGARCFGNASDFRYGILYNPTDTILILPGVDAQVVDRIRRDLTKRTEPDRPELRFVAD